MGLRYGQQNTWSQPEADVNLHRMNRRPMTCVDFLNTDLMDPLRITQVKWLDTLFKQLNP